MKDIKYILKRIIIGIGIALAIMYIKGNFLFNVNAQVLIDNNQLSYNNYLVLQTGSSQFHFYDNTVYQDVSIFPQYFLLSMCTDSNSVNSWSIANNSLSNVNFYNTQINCTFPNSTYTGGHITYIYGQVDPSFSCSVNGTSCFQNGYINFTVPNRSSWALLSYQLSKDAINIDYGSNTIINQNQMILSGQQSIINNQTQNTTDIISNQNSNTQDIIDNQTQNAQDTQDTIKEQFENCIDAHTVHPTFSNVGLNTGSGRPNRYSINNNNSAATLDVSKYVGESITITFTGLDSSHNPRTNYCFGPSLPTSTATSCITSRIVSSANTSNTFTVNVPSNAKYLFLIGYNNYIDNNWVENVTISLPKICSNRLTDINDSLNDDNVDNASNSASSFFSNFSVNSHGLSGIITSPLRLVQTFTTATCSPLTFQLPFVHNTITLPCMKPIIENYFGIFFSLYQLITTGLISYHVLINIYSKIRDLQDPNKDRIEVLNL